MMTSDTKMHRSDSIWSHGNVVEVKKKTCTTNVLVGCTLGIIVDDGYLVLVDTLFYFFFL